MRALWGAKSGVAGLLLAAAVMVGGCSRHVSESYAPPPPPPPPHEEPALMGAPAPSPQSQVEARAAERQAHDDAWVASLPPGVIARRTVDANGRVVWVISNRPVPNPTERHVFYKWHGGYAPHRPHHTYAAAGPRHETPAPVASTPAPVTVAPKIQTAPAPAPKAVAKAVAKAAPAPAPTPAATTPAAEAPRPFVMSPILWLVAGVALVLILLLIMLSSRKPKRRGGSGSGSGHTAPAH
ncbi:MAG: hypothetical protein JSR45_17505 [Proteobacteria bacterium]|nr:hypothetical protein [Pseudomonadota bacterium]